MQIQHHVNTLLPGYWPCCSVVTIQSGQVHCSFDLRNSYNLTEAYSAQPHLSFLRMQTNEDLRDFTFRWGPLFARDVTPVALYWSRQRRLAALIKLIKAVRNRENERYAVEEFVTAQCEDDKLSSPAVLVPPLPAVFYQWPDAVNLSAAKAAIRAADARTIRGVASSVIQGESVVICSAGFDVKFARRPEVMARWKIDSLNDALRWMVWRDEWYGQPVSYCAECNKVFGQENKHERKYCSQECGHKVAARNWARNKRKQVREQASKKRR